MKKKPKLGRPLMLTEPVKERLMQALRAGNFRGVAARYAGISETTLAVWMKLGKDQHHGPFRELRSAVHKAEADAEAHHVGLLLKHAQDDVKATTFYLERKFHKRWGRKDTINATVAIDNEREAIARVFEREFANEPDILRRLYSAIASDVVPAPIVAAAAAGRLLDEETERDEPARVRAVGEPGLPATEAPDAGAERDGEGGAGGDGEGGDSLPTPRRED